MKHSIEREAVRAQLARELEAIRGFERNTEELLSQMRSASPFADLEGQARGLRFNQQMAHLYLERASAVLELLGECRDGDVTTGDELAEFIGAL